MRRNGAFQERAGRGADERRRKMPAIILSFMPKPNAASPLVVGLLTRRYTSRPFNGLASKPTMNRHAKTIASRSMSGVRRGANRLRCILAPLSAQND
jgi:hypothetical protein